MMLKIFVALVAFAASVSAIPPPAECSTLKDCGSCLDAAGRDDCRWTGDECFDSCAIGDATCYGSTGKGIHDEATCPEPKEVCDAQTDCGSCQDAGCEWHFFAISMEWEKKTAKCSQKCPVGNGQNYQLTKEQEKTYMCFDRKKKTNTCPVAQPDCEKLACGADCTSPCPEGSVCQGVMRYCQADATCGSNSKPKCDKPVAKKSCSAEKAGDMSLQCGEDCSNCTPGQPCLTVMTSCQDDGTCDAGQPKCAANDYSCTCGETCTYMGVYGTCQVDGKTCANNIMAPKCKPKVCACNRMLLPVCGDDGVEYSNACQAECQNVKFRAGKCPTAVAKKSCSADKAGDMSLQCGEDCSNCTPGQPCLTVMTSCQDDGTCKAGKPKCPEIQQGVIEGGVNCPTCTKSEYNSLSVDSVDMVALLRGLADKLPATFDAASLRDMFEGSVLADLGQHAETVVKVVGGAGEGLSDEEYVVAVLEASPQLASALMSAGVDVSDIVEIIDPSAAATTVTVTRMLAGVSALMAMLIW